MEYGIWRRGKWIKWMYVHTNEIGRGGGGCRTQKKKRIRIKQKPH